MVPSAEQAKYVEQAAETINSRMSDPVEIQCPTRRVSMSRLDSQRGENAAAVRFNLKKRSVSDERQSVVLSPYNSDFLSGIFADIAQANSSLPPHDDPRLDHSSPAKRSRLSLTRAFCRCSKSYVNLESQTESQSEQRGNTVDLFNGPATALLAQTTQPRESFSKTQPSRQNSLSYQLHCVSSASSNESEEDLGDLAFPHLPAAVSDSTCSSSLTRKSSGQLLPVPETPAKDSYGWFIEMEGEDEAPETTSTVETYKPSTGGLAFQAPTAPKAVNHDAEVEWAKAADTVDDVLGVFF